MKAHDVLDWHFPHELLSTDASKQQQFFNTPSILGLFTQGFRRKWAEAE
jgi:phosphoserine aminotransferase